MFDELYPVIFCFGFLFFAVGAILLIVLMVRVSNFSRRLETLEANFKQLLHDVQRRPVPPAAQSAPPQASVRPPPPQPHVPSQPTEPATPTERLLARQSEIRTPHPSSAPPTPPAPVAPTAAAHASASPPPPPPPRPVETIAPEFRAVPESPGELPRFSLEAFIGVKLFVVLGAIVLALAGIFLFKYGMEQGWFNPERRVFTGTIAGILLIAAAQWRRKREPFIAQGLSAAGIVSLFSAFYAATVMFHFVVQPVGFVLMGLTTAAAVILSLQRPGGGVLLATLGLIGGFLTPYLLRTNVPNAPGLFGYLILLHTGLIVVTRMRGWSILAAISVLFSSAWLIGWLLFAEWKPADGPILGAFMLASTVAMVVGTINQPQRWGQNLAAIGLTWLAGVMGLGAACLLVRASGFTDLEWAYFATLLAGAFVLGRLRPAYEGLAWLSSFAVLAMLMGWCGWEHQYLAEADVPHFRWWMMGLGLGSVAAAFACQWRSVLVSRWSFLTVLLALCYVGAAYGVLGVSPRDVQWGWVPAIGAVILAAGAVPLYLRRRAEQRVEDGLAIFAHGVLGMLLMAAPMAWKDSTLTAAWAVLLPLTALAIRYLRLPALFAGLIAVIGLLVVRGLFLWQVVDAGGEGRWLLWNPVIWVYGSLFAAAAISAWLVEKAEPAPEALRDILPSPRGISALLQVFSAAAAFALVSLEVRWYFHGGNLDAASFLFVERSTYATGWLLLSWALLWLGKRAEYPALYRCGEVAVGAALIYLGAVVITLGNPLPWDDFIAGPIIFNTLMYAFLLPAVLCAALAYFLRSQSRPIGVACAVISAVLVFMLAALEVRHGFVGAHLQSTTLTAPEMGTYSLVWIVLGAAALFAGIRWRIQTLHIAGLATLGAGVAFALTFGGVFLNPVFTHEPVGTRVVFNWLLYIYGIPVIAAGVMARLLEKRSEWERTLGYAFAVVKLLLTFILITLEVQQIFRGNVLGIGTTSPGEMAAYSLAWALYGGALLTAGIIRRNLLLRWASLIVMLGTVVKVFLWDFVASTDLERVGSFTCLGLSLMALAFVYHKLVFRKVPNVDVPRGVSDDAAPTDERAP